MIRRNAATVKHLSLWGIEIVSNIIPTNNELSSRVNKMKIDFIKKNILFRKCQIMIQQMKIMNRKILNILMDILLIR
jgi:hypothetical protein